jgi:hypothetical protein
MGSLPSQGQDSSLGGFGAAALCAQDTRPGLVETRFYRVASGCIRLDFTCAELLSAFGPALEHLRAATPCDPGLAVRVSSGEGQAPPASLVLAETFLEVPNSEAPRLRARYEAQTGCFFALDHDRRQGWFWLKDAAALSPHHRAAPLRALFGWWLAGQGVQCVHAAACGTSDAAVLIAGPGGSGKSTLATACLLDGMQFLADDYLAVAFRPRPHAYSLTGTLKLVPEHAARFFPTLGIEQRGAAADKAVLYLRERFPGLLARSLPLRAILASRLRPGGVSRVTPLPPAHALRALMPSTLALFPGGYPEALTRMSRLLRELPAFEIVIGEDMAAVPALLRGLIGRLGA